MSPDGNDRPKGPESPAETAERLNAVVTQLGEIAAEPRYGAEHCAFAKRTLAALMASVDTPQMQQWLAGAAKRSIPIMAANADAKVVADAAEEQRKVMWLCGLFARRSGTSAQSPAIIDQAELDIICTCLRILTPSARIALDTNPEIVAVDIFLCGPDGKLFFINKQVLGDKTKFHAKYVDEN